MKRILGGGLRPPGGLLLAILLLAIPLAAADPPPRMMLVTNTASYTSSILATSGATALQHDFSRCQTGPSGAVVSLLPGAAELLRNVGPWACAGSFGLVPAPAPPAAAETIVAFDDGAHSASFTLPSLGALHGNDPVHIARPLVSDVVEGAWVTVIPTFDGTPVYIELQDARSLHEPAVERFVARKPITQYRIQAQGLFWVRVSLGTDPRYRCFPSLSCDVYGLVYGFAHSGADTGASVRVSAF
jgi:hypothetical protein